MERVSLTAESGQSLMIRSSEEEYLIKEKESLKMATRMEN